MSITGSNPVTPIAANSVNSRVCGIFLPFVATFMANVNCGLQQEFVIKFATKFATVKWLKNYQQ